MGAGQSTAADDSSHTPPRALHVLRVTPSSPASQTSIEPFFDFVVGFQGDDFSSTDSADATELEKIVENHEGRTLNLLVWNSKSQQTRGTLPFLRLAIGPTKAVIRGQSCQLCPRETGLCHTQPLRTRRNRRRSANPLCLD